MRKISIEVKVGVLLIFAVTMLSAACYLSYRNLSKIVSSIHIDLNPEIRLVTIRSISGELEKADNSVHIYSITRDSSDLIPYYMVIDGIDKKVNLFRAECSDDKFMLNQADTISSLIAENILNWNRYLYLTENYNVSASLRQLSDSIANAPEKVEKKGILKRVFSRKPDNQGNQQGLISDIREIENKSILTKEKLRDRETQLDFTSSKIKEKFYDLISRMENQVSILVREKAVAAKQLAEETYKWLIIFAVSGVLLIILVSFIIIRYIRNANKYQVALEKSKNETENLSRTRELFMANVSHEIRTPVTAISGFTEQLFHETADEKVRGSLRIIKSSSDHLARIIDDILDLSKLQNGKLILENVHFSINQILNEVYSLFEQRAAGKNLLLSFSLLPGTPPVLQGDPYRLKQILINLVGNAVKFTETGSVRFVAGGTANINGDVDLTIEVTDTGIGIEEDKLKIVFEDFTQAEMSTARKYGGTGLGLSIVKKLVELHKGTIECESKINQGTRIACHLPLLTGREDHLRKDITTTLNIPEWIRNLKVLVVDDEEYNRLLFKKILDRWAIKNEVATNGMEAIEILKEKRYDLLFMDIRMPGIDGLRVTRFLREELKISESEMKVICISAATPDGEAEKRQMKIYNAYLQKPFTEESLLTTILALGEKNSEFISEKPVVELNTTDSENRKLNLKNLYHISGGDEQFVKQMLISFNTTTGEGISEMQEAVSSGKWDSTANIAHKMLAPCRHLGAVELCNLLTEIEKSASNNSDRRTIVELADKIGLEFKYVRELVKEQIGKLK